MEQTHEKPSNGDSRCALADGSGSWAPILVAAIITDCRQKIGTLRMKMPINVAIALGRADEELADAQAWMRAEADVAASRPNA